MNPIFGLGSYIYTAYFAGGATESFCGLVNFMSIKSVYLWLQEICLSLFAMILYLDFLLIVLLPYRYLERVKFNYYRFLIFCNRICIKMSYD